MAFVFEDSENRGRFQFEDDIPPGNPNWGALKKTLAVTPAKAAILGRQFLRGATLGAVDVPTPEAEAYLEKMEADPVPEWAKYVSGLGGEFAPIGWIGKILAPLVRRAIPAAGAIRTAASEAALTGVTYEAAKGAAQGRPPLETLQGMGYAAPTWAGLGAAAGKFGQLIGRKNYRPEDVLRDPRAAEEEIQGTIPYRKPELRVTENLPEPPYVPGPEESIPLPRRFVFESEPPPVRELRPEEKLLMGTVRQPPKPYREPPTIIGEAGAKPGPEIITGEPTLEQARVAVAMEKPGFLRTTEDRLALKERLLTAESPPPPGPLEIPTTLTPRAKTRTPEGYINMDLLTTGSGAGVGALLDEDDRWRGAVIGGTVGFTISRGLARRILPPGAKALPRGVKPIKDGFEIPPIQEGELTEPVLRRPTTRKIDRAAPDIFEAAGMKRDPERFYNDQLLDAATQLPQDLRRSILKEHGLTDTELVSDLLGMKRETVRIAAQTMAYSSQAAQKIAKIDPEAARAMDDLLRAQTDDAGDALMSWWRRADNIRRGLLVSQLSTAMRNAETQAGRVGLDVFEQGLNATLERIFRKPAKTNFLDGLDQFLGIFRGKNRADVEKILADYPKESSRLFSRYMADIQAGGAGQWPEKVVAMLNTANRFQENTIRRTVFMGKLSQRLRSKGLDLAQVVENNQTGQIGPEDLRYAVNEALEFTWAQAPKFGGVAHAFVNLVNKLPGATFVIPFPRFLMNSLKFTFEYNPTGLLKLLSAQERAALAAGDMKVISRAILGTGMLGAAYQVRSSEYAGDKWYELNVGGKTIDLLPYNPFGAYLFVADMIKKTKDGNLDKLTWGDIGQGVLSSNMRAGAGLYALDRIIDGFTSEGEFEKSLNVIKQFGGEVAGGFLTPLNQVKEFLAGFDDYIVRDKRQDPFWGPIKEKIPFVEGDLPPAHKPTRAGPITRKAPAFRQMTGLGISEKNPLESELDRLGFDRREILPSTGNAEADNLVARLMGELTEDVLLPIISEPFYQEMGDGQRGIFLQKFRTKIRAAARKEAMIDNPELMERVKEEHVPRRQKKFRKEMELE